MRPERAKANRTARPASQGSRAVTQVASPLASIPQEKDAEQGDSRQPRSIHSLKPQVDCSA